MASDMPLGILVKELSHEKEYFGNIPTPLKNIS